MITLAQVKKLVNEQFKLQSVKVTNDQGKQVVERNYQNKIIKGIYTGVTHSPVDVTDVKYEKLRNLKQNIGDLLAANGGVKQGSYLYKFTTKNGKEFIAEVTEFDSISNLNYPSYKSVYLEVVYYYI